MIAIISFKNNPQRVVLLIFGFFIALHVFGILFYMITPSKPGQPNVFYSDISFKLIDDKPLSEAAVMDYDKKTHTVSQSRKMRKVFPNSTGTRTDYFIKVKCPDTETTQWWQISSRGYDNKIFDRGDIVRWETNGNKREVVKTGKSIVLEDEGFRGIRGLEP